MTESLRCERCDTPLAGEDPRCVICGFLNGKPCFNCDTLMPLDARICTACGTTLSKPEAAPEPVASVSTLDGRTEDSLDHVPAPEDFPSGSTRPMPANPNNENDVVVDLDDLPLVHDSGQTIPKPTVAAEPAKTNPLLEPTGTTVQLDAIPTPNPLQPKEPDPKGTRKIDEKDYEEILRTCRDENATGSRLFGLFGRPEAGKTSFIYSVGKIIQNGRSKGPLGQYSIDGNWRHLLNDMDRMFESGQIRGTERGLHPFKGRPLHRGRGNRPFVFLDIRGEQFEQIDDWSAEITHFFITYLRQCSGFFLFLDIDEDTVAPSKADVIDRMARKKNGPLDAIEKQVAIDIYNYKSSQMAHMVSFLAVAAQVPRIADGASFQEQKSDLEKARREENIGKHKLDIPVSLCISKADRLKDFKFRDYPAIVPGADSLWGDPWEVISEIWGGHLQNMKRIVPHLKVEWVSSLGDNFKPERGIGRPRGVESVFDFVVGQPPPNWSMSSRRYFQLRKWLKV